MSVVYVRRNGTGTSGTFYHGCNGSHTLNLSGTANTNPYFGPHGIDNFPQDVWLISIGFIRANSETSTSNSGIGGIYRLDTGEKIHTHADFKMKSGSTQQRHRTYLYYSTQTTASLSWAKPMFYVVDGSEPTLSSLIKPQQDANINIGARTIASGAINTTGNVTLGTFSTTNSGTLILTGTTANTKAEIKCTNGNLHIDAEAGNATYINYFEGTSGVFFGTGASGHQAHINSAGGINLRGSGAAPTNSAIAVNGTSILDNSRNLTSIGTISSGIVTAPLINATATGMSEFATNMSSQDDFINSPISIRERGLAGAGDAEDRDSPNLNFHWGGRVSNSLWMNSSGHLNWGSYSTSGVPTNDGTFKSGTIDIRDAAGTADRRIHIPRAGGITFYGDSSSNHSIFSRGRAFTSTDDLRINSYGALYINLDSNSNNNNSADFVVGRHGGSGAMATSQDLLVVNGENGNVNVAYDNACLTFGIPSNGANVQSCWGSMEGNTDTSGEGSGRLFFREHNSSVAAGDNYGMSLGYRGGATSVTTALGNQWTGLSQIGNGQWGMWGHNNDATGALIMSGDRAATQIDFHSNNFLAVGTIASGSIVSSGNVTAFSDKRLKENIQTLDGKKALQMRGVSFIKDGEEGSGVIAQEVEKIAPELVMTADDEMGTKSVAYGNLVGYLIETVKDQQKQIDELKERLDNDSSD